MLSLFDDFMVRATLAGLGTALAAAPLGCFVVWRRMAYFGDAMAHAAILGVALALAFEISIVAGVLAIALAVALLLTVFTSQGHGTDTVLGVLSHSALALGLVAISLFQGVRIDLMGYLFGDILVVSTNDLAIIWSGAVVATLLLLWRWQAMLMSTLNPDLAFASGIRPGRERLILTLALAILVAVGIKVVGALLISSLLIIPAAAARPLARTPEAMAAIAAAIGGIAVLGGLRISAEFDTPAGPSIVALAAIAFAASSVARALRS